MISIITQRGWASDRVKIGIFQALPVNITMGLCLQSQGLPQAEQLKVLDKNQHLHGFGSPDKIVI